MRSVISTTSACANTCGCQNSRLASAAPSAAVTVSDAATSADLFMTDLR
jgi:hypothetical protein